MYMNKIKIGGFGKFSNIEFSLKKGFNVIYGDNETGKSTLQWFIRGIFYGLQKGRTSKDGLLPPIKRLKPWEDNKFHGSISYISDDGRLYIIERNFLSDIVKVFDENYNEISKDFALDKNRKISPGLDLFGMDEELFTSTVFVGQMETRSGSENYQYISDLIDDAQKTASSNLSYTKAIEALNRALKEIAGTDRTTTKPLDRLKKNLAEIQKQINEIIEQKMIFNNRETQLEQNRYLLERLEKHNEVAGLLKQKIITKKKLQECIDKKRSITGLCTQMENILKELAIRKSELDSLNNKIGELSRFGGSSVDDLQEVQILYRDLRKKEMEIELNRDKLSEQLQNIKEINEAQKAVKKDKSNTIFAALVIASIMACSLSAVFWNGELKIYSIMAGAFLSLVFVILWALSWKKKMTARKENKIKLSAISNSEEKTREFLIELRQEYFGLSSKLYDKIYRESPGTMDRPLNDKAVREYGRCLMEYLDIKPKISYLEERIADLNKRMNEADENIKNITGYKLNHERTYDFQKTLDSFREEIDRLNIEEQDLNEKIAGIISSESLFEGITYNNLLTDNSDNIGEMENFYEKLMGELKKQQEEIISKIAGLEALTKESGYEEKLHEMEENKALIEEKLNCLNEFSWSINTALSCLEEAAGEVKRDFSPALNEKLSELARVITGDRYGNVKSDKRMNLNIPAAGADIMNVCNLSGGTADQLYLALRITLGIIVSVKQKLPFIFDEVLACYDDQRSLNSIKLFDSISEERQVIMFTCKSRELEYIKTVSNSVNIIML